MPETHEILVHGQRKSQKDFSDVYNNLFDCIDKDNSSLFEKQLKEKSYRYKDCVMPPVDEIPPHCSFYQLDEARPYTYCVGRPVIETLFFEEVTNLLDIIDRLLIKDSEKLYEAFINSLEGTDLTQFELFNCSIPKKPDVLEQIKKLENYGNSLKNQKIKKGDIILTLVKELRELDENQISNVNNASNQGGLEYKPSRKEQFSCVQFKLNFMCILHKYDKQLEAHRDWKRFLVNFLSLLFSFGVANLVNYASSGNFLFFNKTKSMGLVEELDNQLCLPSSGKK